MFSSKEEAEKSAAAGQPTDVLPLLVTEKWWVSRVGVLPGAIRVAGCRNGATHSLVGEDELQECLRPGSTPNSRKGSSSLSEGALRTRRPLPKGTITITPRKDKLQGCQRVPLVNLPYAIKPLRS